MEGHNRSLPERRWHIKEKKSSWVMFSKTASSVHTGRHSWHQTVRWKNSFLRSMVKMALIEWIHYVLARNIQKVRKETIIIARKITVIVHTSEWYAKTNLYCVWVLESDSFVYIAFMNGGGREFECAGRMRVHRYWFARKNRTVNRFECFGHSRLRLFHAVENGCRRIGQAFSHADRWGRGAFFASSKYGHRPGVVEISPGNRFSRKLVFNRKIS